MDGVATSLADLARLAREDGDLDRARACCCEALEAGSIGQRAVVRVVEELAALAAASGEAQRALVLFAAAARACATGSACPPPVSKRRYHVADDRGPARAPGTGCARPPGAGDGT